MSRTEHWERLTAAIAEASSLILSDRDPISDRERADAERYVLRILRAVTETSLLDFDFDTPSFITMPEVVRHLGGAGPDIDYDVAILSPDRPYRIVGRRGEASYVGIAVYGGAAVDGANDILASIDLDDIAAADGSFTFDIDAPGASRLIVRQYFHDRSRQIRGEWTIERTDAAPPPRSSSSSSSRGEGDRGTQPHPAIVAHQIANASDSLVWNASLNQLWTPERRDHPNEFVRQTPDDIMAAIPNPDVMYAFTWWRLDEGEQLEVVAHPPDTRYWAIQLCDRWFQCYPQRRTNLHDRQVDANADGSVTIMLADGDPGHPNWLDTGGHHTGVVFFRWLHAEPDQLPSCRVVRPT